MQREAKKTRLSLHLAGIINVVTTIMEDLMRNTAPANSRYFKYSYNIAVDDPYFLDLQIAGILKVVKTPRAYRISSIVLQIAGILNVVTTNPLN